MLEFLHAVAASRLLQFALLAGVLASVAPYSGLSHGQSKATW